RGGRGGGLRRAPGRGGAPARRAARRRGGGAGGALRGRGRRVGAPARPRRWRGRTGEPGAPSRCTEPEPGARCPGGQPRNYDTDAPMIEPDHPLLWPGTRVTLELPGLSDHTYSVQGTIERNPVQYGYYREGHPGV